MKQQVQRFTCAVLALALLLSLGLTALPAFAAEEDTAPERGVITYTEPVAPQYEAIEKFSDGLAAAKKDGKWGFVDYSNNAVIDFQYDGAHSFSDGLAPVQKDGKWGFIDHGNNTVVDFQYDLAYEFSEGKAVVGYYETVPDEYDEDFVYENLYLGFVTTGGIYTPFEDPNGEKDHLSLWTEANHVRSVAEFSGGIVSITTEFLFGNMPDTTYIYNSNGALISRDYCYAEKANEGLIPIRDTTRSPHDAAGRLFLGGWIDMDGNVVHQYELEYFGPEYEREDEDGWTYTDRSYRHIHWVGPFTDGLAPALQEVYNAETEEKSNLLGFIDRATFDWAIEPQYESYAYAFGDNVGPLAIFLNGLAMVTKDGQRGAIDKRGRTVIPFQYELSLPLQEGRIPFQQDGKWGYLSAAAPYEVVIPAQYERVTGFNNGLAVAYDGTDAFLIDWYGNRVPGVDTLDPSVYFHKNGEVTSPDEYVTILRDGKYGIGHIEYLPELPEKTVMSGWAYDEVVDAIEKDLVPVDLQNLYHSSITRIEFSRVMVQTVAAALGQDIADVVLEHTGRSLASWQNDYPFADTSSRDVIAACALGIVEGTGGKTFDPHRTISRQEAAVMLARTVKLIGIDTAGIEDAGFADQAQTAGWAAESVNIVSHYDIMNGSDNRFSPLGACTREQAYMTALRLIQAAEK